MTQPTGGYTSDEISNATQALVQTTVRYQTDSLGSRQTSITFSHVQQAAIGLFLLFPTSPFYIVSLGASRLDEELQTQATQVAQLLSLVQAAGRSAFPINDVTPLSNARAALFALQGAAASRTTPFSSISSAPAFQRFSSNVDAFVTANRSSVVSGGQVVPTPQDAKAQIRTLLSTVLTTQQDLITKAAFLENALTDYNAADLPAVATSSIFQNATQNIATLVAQLEQQSPTQRLESLRDTVLQLLAARAVVRQVGSFTQPSSIYPFIGTGTPYADASHPGNPATLPATLHAPYNINNTPLITIALDGQPAQSGTLNNGLFAELFGSKIEPFHVTAFTAATLVGTGTGPYTVTGSNNALSFTVSIPGSGPVQVSITIPSAIYGSAAALASAINTQIDTTYPGLVGVYDSVDDPSHTFVELRSASNTGSGYGIQINPGSANTLLGYTVGQSTTGTDFIETLKVTETTSATTVTVTVPPGSYSAAAMVTQLNTLLNPFGFTVFAQGNAGNQFIDIRYIGGGSISTTPFKAGISFPSSNNPMASVLGISTGITFNAQPATARSVAANLNKLFPTLNATVAVDPFAQGANLTIRSEPSDPSRFVAYLFSGTATAASLGVGSIQLTFPQGGLLAAGVTPTMAIAIRSGANANTLWTATTVTDTQITASGVGTPTAGPCTLEIGPAFSSLISGVVQIPSGINAGIYTITKYGPTSLHVPFELEVNAVIHGVVQANGLPYVNTGNVGREKVVFNSQSTATSSAISVSGAASSYFFSASPPIMAVGTTPFLQLSDQVAGLGPGDSIEYYNTQYNVPDLVFSIQSLSNNIVGISPAISDTQTLNFTEGSPPPFSLIRSGAFAAFQTFSQRLLTWLGQAANQSKFFDQLRVALNVVMTEAQATASQINTALTLLLQLQDLLLQANSSSPTTSLEYAMVNYVVNRVQPVDNLVKTFQEKGSDKAIDTLLQGQFAEFFGLDQSGVSYAGAMQAQVRAVALNALPVRKVDRSSTVTSQVQSRTTSPDFEYASSDIDKTATPIVPSEFEKVSPVDQNNP
jgi:hypothetical protein